MPLSATAVRFAALCARFHLFLIKYKLASSKIAVVEFSIAWNKGRLLVLNPKCILADPIIKKATASGMAMETMTMGTVRFFSFISYNIAGPVDDPMPCALVGYLYILTVPLLPGASVFLKDRPLRLP